MLLLLFLLACDEPSTVLDADFADRLTDRYACGINWYVAYDEDRTIRLQTGFRTEHGEDPGDADEGPIDGEEAALQVYTGECLRIPGCTDDTTGVRCTQQIAHKYEGTSGTLALAADARGVEGQVDDLVLEGTEGEESLSISTLLLPHAGFWSEDAGR